MCRMCGKLPESLAHTVAACSSLAQTNYMDRHNATLNVLFFELLRDLKLANSVPLWYTRVDPKQMYEPTDAQAFWDVPFYAEHTFVQANRAPGRRSQSEEGASCGNELPLAGQSREEGH